MSENEVEIRVERAMDRLDKRFMGGFIDQAEYDREVAILDKWARQQIDAAKPAPFREDFRNYA